MCEKTVLVSGLQKEIEENDLFIYFQSKKNSDGGDVDKIDYHPDSGTAEVTFQSVEVAHRVANGKKHSLKGHALTVSKKHFSNRIKFFEERGLIKSKQPNTEGGNPTSSHKPSEREEDDLMNFTELPKTLDCKNVSNYLKLKTLKVSKQLVSFLTSNGGRDFLEEQFKIHNVDAQLGLDNINLTLDAVDHTNLIKAIEIIKKVTAEEIVAVDTQNQWLINSDKLPILELTSRFEKILVTCEDMNRISIAGSREKVLEAKAWLLSFFEDNSFESLSILVRDIPDNTPEDALQNYFENKRRSDGGDVKEIKRISNSQAIVTFQSPEIAQRVLKWVGHTIDNCRLVVTKMKPAPPKKPTPTPTKAPIPEVMTKMKPALPKKPTPTLTKAQVAEEKSRTVKITGISDKTTKDALLNFFENKRRSGGGSIQDIQYNQDEGIADITFYSTEDLENIQKKCSRPLDGNHLQVKQVSICDCITVSGLGSNTTRDTILYYFENPSKSGGGDVENVEYINGETKAVVFFKDPSVVDRLVSRDHVINGQTLQVAPHHPFLGVTSEKPGGGTKEKQFQSADPYALAFINKLFKQEFEELLLGNGVKLYQEQGKDGVILVAINNMMDKDKWEDSCRIIERYINQITTHEIKVSSAAWEETIQQCEQKVSTASAKINIEFKKELQRILLQGKKQDVDSLAEKLDDSSTEIEKKIEYEKAKITEKIEFTKPQLELLNFVDGIEKLMAPLKDLEVSIDNKATAIHFRGPDSVVKKGNMLVWQYLSKMKDQEIDLSSSVVAILTSDAGNLFLSKQFKDQQIEAVISCSDDNDDTRVIITAVDRLNVNRAVDYIKFTAIEDSISLAPDQNLLILSNGWQKLMQDFEKSELFKVTTDSGTNTITITGIIEDVGVAKAQILKFMVEHAIIDKTVEADAGRIEYFFRFQQDKLVQIKDELDEHSVYITQNSNGQGFKICGTKEGTEKATKRVLQLINQIKDKSIEIEKPGVKKLFNDNKGQKLLSNIENDYTCIIERVADGNNRDTAGNANATDDQASIKASPVSINDAPTPQFKIDIIVGDIAKQEADAIVNTVAGDLDLTKNKSAKALSNAAGPQLQQECKEKGTLKRGEVITTEGFSLGCKNVFHVVAGDWQNGKGEKVLRALIVSCLEEADKRGFSSIAFPAIGTGNLEYPRDVVAKVFFEEVNSFKKAHPTTSILEVRLVLLSLDQPTIDAFQKEEINWPMRGDDDVCIRNVAKEDQSSLKENPVSINDAATPNIHIIVGDLAKQKADAIVNTVAGDLDLTKNKSAKALSNAAGPQLQQECKTKGPLKKGEVLITKGFRLGCKDVFHIVVGDWEKGKGEKVLRALIVSCLKEADKRGFSSIAFPAIGTGNLGFPRDVVAKVFFEEVNSFKKNHPQTSVLEVRFVLFHQDQLTIDAFQKEQKNWGNPAKENPSRNQPFLEREKDHEDTPKTECSSGNVISGGGDKKKAEGPSHIHEVELMAEDSFRQQCKMYLKVFASSESILKEADTAIKELIKEQTKSKVIDKHASAIQGLSQTQVQRIFRLQEKYLTEIEIQKDSAKIIISGLSDDVADTAFAIYEILNEKTEAELLSTNVQWYYDESDKREAYDVITNAKIEKAFNEKKDMITLSKENDKKMKYKIVFATMKETNLDTGDETDVHREEQIKGILLPPNWNSQPKDANGKAKNVHLAQLDPAKNQQEYDGVLAAITKSSLIDIVKMERVQNPELYRAYMMKKQQMDDKDGSNEKKLFHGTAVETCNLINHKGFNRSYCGKNATYYGKGVYFARDASYSMQDKYSPRNPNGNRCMYLASVLVGQFTVGNKNMIAPPPKDPNNPTITYETTVNDINDPQVFVAYHDSQVYPEYLITFK